MLRDGYDFPIILRMASESLPKDTYAKDHKPKPGPDTKPIGARKGSRKRQIPATGDRKRSRVEELEHGRREIEALGLEEYCFVLQF